MIESNNNKHNNVLIQIFTCKRSTYSYVRVVHDRFYVGWIEIGCLVHISYVLDRSSFPLAAPWFLSDRSTLLVDRIGGSLDIDYKLQSILYVAIAM